MPRARNIKPAFFDNEFLGQLPGDIQILFIGLWTQADREGVVEYRPAKLKKALFGFRTDIDDEKLNGYVTVLERLDNGSMLTKVQHDGRCYLIIKNFTQHQNPHHTEKKGKNPPLKTLLEAKDSDLTVTTPLNNGYTPADSGFLIPDCGKEKLVKRKILVEKPKDVSEKIWNDFIKLRKQKKADISEIALERIIKEAQKAGYTLSQALEEIILRGWTGFKAEWVQRDKQKSTHKFGGANYDEGTEGFDVH